MAPIRVNGNLRDLIFGTEKAGNGFYPSRRDSLIISYTPMV